MGEDEDKPAKVPDHLNGRVDGQPSIVTHEFVGVTHDDMAICLQYWRERMHHAIREPMKFAPGDIEYIAENIERLSAMCPEDCREEIHERAKPFSGEYPRVL